jgi:hypothetical protein
MKILSILVPRFRNLSTLRKDKVMVNTVVIGNVDRDLLSEQTLELVNLLWDKPDSKLWGLVEMLNSWYDNNNPTEER